VEALKKLVLRNPAVLKLEDSDLPDSNQLSQHLLYCLVRCMGWRWRWRWMRIKLGGRHDTVALLPHLCLRLSLLLRSHWPVAAFRTTTSTSSFLRSSSLTLSRANLSSLSTTLTAATA
jgi:hypothetical protein